MAKTRSKARHLTRPSATLEGQLLAGRYQVRSVLGSAGMGIVYDAVDILSGDPLAIKALKPGTATTERVRRLRREAEIGRLLDHSHICRVFHLGVHRGTSFIAMERLDGETLAARVKQTGPLAAADAIGVGIQLLEALQAVHAARVLHRDVKPSNVFVTTPRGQPPVIKLIDFGLACGLTSSIDDEEVSAITGTDMIPGTPRYLTPEQLSGERLLDARVDVWAAALTLYEVLAARPAYHGNRFDLAQQICYAPPPSLRTLRADLPPDLDEILACALSKRREERFAAADGFRSALVDVWARHRVEGLARAARYLR